jgi:hypothetical protein
MDKLDKKKVVLLTATDAKGLEILAKNNTSGNEAELFRRLLRMAIRHPEMFGLLDDEDK